MKNKQTILYHAKYRKPYESLLPSFLPKSMPYLVSGAEIKRIELMAAGIIEINGVKLEFQDIRIFNTIPEGL